MARETVGQGGLRLSRAARKEQILRLLAARWLPYSTHGLARACGLTPSPHFKSIVFEMYSEGLIDGHRSRKENGREVYYWFHPKRNLIHGQSELPLEFNHE